MADETTIAIRRSTRDALKKYGRKDETYDQLILRLLEEVEQCSRGNTK